MASSGGLHHHHHLGSVNCQLLPLVGCCAAGAWSLASQTAGVGPSGELLGGVIFVVQCYLKSMGQQCSRWNNGCQEYGLELRKRIV